MLARMLLLLGISAGATWACSCVELSVREKLSSSDVVFRGTIVEFRFAQDTGKVAVFLVSRVWKGNVGKTFEMPAIEETAACFGFNPSSLKAGNELLVYANDLSKKTYVTNICGYHKLAANAANDLKELGGGRPPR